MYQIYNAVAHLPDAWDVLTKHDIFLQSAYLNALEASSPSNIKWYYIGVFKEEKLVGVAIIQRVQLYVKDMFRNNQVSCVKDFLKDQVSKILKGNILVVGNLMHTGQHGIYFRQTEMSQNLFLTTVFDALKAIEQDIKKLENKTIRSIVFKDYFAEDGIHNEKEFFNSHNLYQVTVQPNMIMEVQSNWIQFQDYISELNKKYRDRYKRARKKLNSITSRELNLEAIKAHQRELYHLYLNVSENAQFNTFILSEHHFYHLKLQLKDDFKVYGYYLNNELVGFYTLILNGNVLETYFLGYDKEHQYPNQLYLNMLYDMAQFGINHQFKTIVYARTAMEIKSSVGAEAKPMVMYLKHTNSILNAVLKQIFGLMNPRQDWEPRHPFK
ncbi:GNAT family N-acetyltransferase [Aestuariibaculum suncheonense]|uniref:GNAT family N-acetyltransferase n=1 Tax=Aestuariibaculum suncheonense TaxID=1028745 RepID=A0A8J6UM85_9FLAO|nr:GNAT family N-acetyltransferase [Aestuariibaculum suncheonense]MBD0836716.1 GNAT family N-acetyltransferase [Aestuariibaculum suncheonense]